MDCFFLGPSFTDLKNQTRDDLRALCDFENAMTDPNHRNFIKIAVENKLFARNGEAANSWLERLREDNGNTLFMLVHDEAHYGIASDGEINQFLRRVADTATASRAKCAALLVSATLHVLTEIPEVNPDFPPLTRIPWTRQEVGPSYVSIYDLVYEADPDIGAIKDRRPRADDDDNDVGTISASAVVVQQYKDTWDSLKPYLDRGQLPPPNPLAGACYQILLALVSSKAPIMAGVRLKMIDHQVDLVNFLIENGAEKYFNVVTAPPSTRDPIGNDIPLTKSTLLVLVDKVGMGQRIPKETQFWDVRCRYKATATSNLARFIQDVGRCAGHNKPKARVFVGVASWQNDIQTLHGLLKWRASTSELVLSSKHPEEERGVYFDLASRVVLLLAEPQMGKTGVILALLHSIFQCCRATTAEQQQLAEAERSIEALPPAMKDLLLRKLGAQLGLFYPSQGS